MNEPRVEERTQMGTITVMVSGQLRQVEVPLTIIDTYHPDGRKDCEVRVPKIEVSPFLKGES